MLTIIKEYEGEVETDSAFSIRHKPKTDSPYIEILKVSMSGEVWINPDAESESYRIALRLLAEEYIEQGCVKL